MTSVIRRACWCLRWSTERFASTPRETAILFRQQSKGYYISNLNGFYVPIAFPTCHFQAIPVFLSESASIVCLAWRTGCPCVARTGGNHPCSVKFAWMLESVGTNSSALRLIARSHLNPFHDVLRTLLFPFPPPGEPPKIPIASLPAYACEAEPGDLVVLNLGDAHGSFLP